MSPSAERFSGRRVAVVGAGSQPCDHRDAPPGIGRAIAVRLSREGARVVCLDRDLQAAAQTADLIRSEGGSAEVVEADIGSDNGLVCGLDGIRAGQLDGLVLNAGIGRGLGTAETTARQWDLTFAVSVRAHFLLVRGLLPLLRAPASIVFIGSVAGLRPVSGSIAYDTAKAALLGLCRNVALEAATTGVRANLIAPGLIDTPLGRAASRGRHDRDKTAIPLGRQGSAWEVAAVAAFLLSDDAAYVTGQTLVVDGGMTLL